MTTFNAEYAANKATIITDGKFDLKKVTAKTKSIATRGRKLDLDIHTVAVACLHFAMPADNGGSNNAEPARQLLTAMPKGSRAKTLADWFEAYSNIRLNMGKDGKWSVGLFKGETKLDGAAMEEKAILAAGTPFWTVEEKTAGATAFDFGSALSALLNKAEKAIAKGSIDEDSASRIVDLQAWIKDKGITLPEPKKSKAA